MKSPTHLRVILASNSPRRHALLREIVPNFEIAPPRDIDESYPKTMDVLEVASFLSQVKANGYADLVDADTVLITADTVVVVDDKILGKPRSTEQAFEMLKQLSGRMHKVITGVTLMSAAKKVTFSHITEVYFDEIPEEQLRQYIEEFKPFDKAGSYGIQEWIGCRGIKGMKGCFYNVMGLPVNDLYNHLESFSRT